MPTYEYRCTNCGEDLEVVQSFHDDPLTECPHCKGKLRKVFSPIGIAFKGSGFYKTDNRSSSSTVPAGSGNGGSSTSSAGSDSTTTSGSSDSSGSSAKSAGTSSDKTTTSSS